MLKWMALLVVPLLCACPSLRNLTRLDEMEAAEYDRYVIRLSAQVGAVAGVAVAEGDLDAATAQQIAGALRALASGTAAGIGGALSDTLDLDAYGVLVLSIAIVELDAALEERGAYDDEGFLDERARGVLMAVADAIESAAE